MALRVPGRARRRAPQRSSLSPLEGTIAGEIVTALRAIGCDVSSTQQKRRSRQTSGLPDLWATHVAWGVFAWLEVKQPGEYPSAVQRKWHEKTRAAGVPVLVVRSAADAVQQFAALPRRRCWMAE